MEGAHAHKVSMRTHGKPVVTKMWNPLLLSRINVQTTIGLERKNTDTGLGLKEKLGMSASLPEKDNKYIYNYGLKITSIQLQHEDPE